MAKPKKLYELVLVFQNIGTVDSQNSGQQNSGLLAFFGNNFENRHVRTEVSLTDGLISC